MKLRTALALVSFVALTALALVSFVAARVPPADPEKVAQEAALQGEWKLVAYSGGGKEAPEKEIATGKLVVTGDKMTFTFLDFETPATFTLYPGAIPPAINLKTEAGRTKGIYKLEKDRLTISVGVSVERPEDFTAAEGINVMVLEKVKK
jgi:uncharacterized protein (TIGR03067 family)